MSAGPFASPRLARYAPASVEALLDDASGLSAVLVVDDETRGPGAGGIRTLAYPSDAAQLDDALALARAMTLKCALAGLAAGGAKLVVRDHPGLDRARAFAALGALLAARPRAFHTAGDLGTTLDDLRAARRTCATVHVDEGLDLAAAAARTVVLAAQGARVARGLAPALDGQRVAVQGVGEIGRAVATAFARAGARVAVADVDDARARVVARAVDGVILDPARVLEADVDLLAPCAHGGVLDAASVDRVRAPLVVGGANNILVGRVVERALFARGVVVVPDVISSSGAVALGVSRTVMGAPEVEPFLGRAFANARAVIDGASATDLPSARAARRAAELLAAGGRPRTLDVDDV